MVWVGQRNHVTRFDPTNREKNHDSMKRESERTKEVPVELNTQFELRSTAIKVWPCTMFICNFM